MLCLFIQEYTQIYTCERIIQALEDMDLREQVGFMGKVEGGGGKGKGCNSL